MKTIVDYAELIKEKHALNETIAPVETDLTDASQAYAIGAKFIYDGTLYRAKTAIAQHDALVLNTNYEAAPDVETQIANEAATISAMGAKNILPFDLNAIKDLNTSGTWASNVYSYRGVDFTVNPDGTILADGQATGGNASIKVFAATSSYEMLGKNVILNGCPSGGSATTYRIQAYRMGSVDGSGGTYFDDGDGTVAFGALNNASGTVGSFAVAVYENYDADNLLFKPMVRLATDSNDTYQPYAKTNVELTDDVSSLNSAITNVNTRVDKLVESVCYGFHIDGNESNPSDMVTYLADAVGMTPAKMDYANSKFDYGSWEDAFFMPRPCMLKSDGTVDYYLDPDDYSKKVDGTTASDVSNTSYDGNAMMEWGQNGKKIWLKIVPKDSGKSADVFIANAQLDDNYHDWSFHNCDGVSADHFYTPIYNGSVISSKMRSLSGQQVSKTLDGTAEITAAKANNASAKELWNIECVADRFLINMLLILMGKSTDTQTVFGQGANTSGSEAINDTFRTGVHDAKGLFWGTNSGTVSSNNFANVVKVFGMENYWGFQWRRTNGYILADGTQKVKLTYGKEDGSNVVGYNTDGADYISISGATPTGTSGNYISEMKFAEQGMFGKDTSGTSSTYYCDAQWYNNSGSRFALFGGLSSDGAGVGAFSCNLNNSVSDAYWSRGAALSCKPLA